mmetsp:Transcript_19098/g.56225  ORF Transcript_19098/g.56225 Transcript_19098/m.56225 type:complete len:208 (-) Transcript_19098:172-795(-)
MMLLLIVLRKLLALLITRLQSAARVNALGDREGLPQARGLLVLRRLLLSVHHHHRGRVGGIGLARARSVLQALRARAGEHAKLRARRSLRELCLLRLVQLEVVLLYLLRLEHRLRLGLCVHILTGYNVNQEVEYAALRHGHGQVVALQGTALVLLGVHPGSQGELTDEQIARLGEDHRGLSGYHLHILIRLHNLLNASQRELVCLKV